MSAVQQNEFHSNETSSNYRQIDSVYVFDSIVIREKPDTVIRERWRTLWREHVVHDTIYDRRTDTIKETVCVERITKVPSSSGKAGWVVAAVLFLLIIIQTLIKRH